MGVFRLLHTTSCCLQVNKSALAVLREKTGYTFANCRKALELNNNDATKAEEWLKQQAKALGWGAAVKVKDRKTGQGLIGVAVNRKKISMVEVNCETDFVSKNEKFKSLVEMVTLACLELPVLNSQLDTNKFHLDADQLGKLKVNGNNIADEVALTIGAVGENLSLKRGFCYETNRNDINIAVTVHPPLFGSKVFFGKYGSFVSFTRNMNSSKASQKNTEELGGELCKHIIGMNPSKIGQMGVDQPCADPDDEKVLIYQEYLLDPSITVGEWLEDSGATVVDFKRFECGELEEEDKVQENKANA